MVVGVVVMGLVGVSMTIKFAHQTHTPDYKNLPTMVGVGCTVWIQSFPDGVKVALFSDNKYISLKHCHFILSLIHFAIIPKINSGHPRLLNCHRLRLAGNACFFFLSGSADT